jgi:hypothetical protein
MSPILEVAPLACRYSGACKRLVDAKRPGAIASQEDENRRIQQRKLSLILNRPSAPRDVGDELRRDHFKEQQDRNWTYEQPENQK